MKRTKRAFTLIELLVVIAIIAILAAILFPVFAQAKMSAKTAAGLSNVKQLAVSNQLYYADYDDTRMGRQQVDDGSCLSYRQLTDPYAKSAEIFTDSVNPLAKYYEGFSDQAIRNIICPVNAAPLGTTKRYRRGYDWVNLFGQRGGGGYWDGHGLNLSQVDAPATIGDIAEASNLFADLGPFLWWWDKVDEDTNWLGAAAPVTGGGWNGGNGGKYGGKAMNVAYLDGHAKRTSYSSICGPWMTVDAPGGTVTVTNSAYKTFWNFSIDDINATGQGWMAGAVEQYCQSLPAQFK
ncbi:MAG: prepilin-type N-terminal cleavage/methylation domain-containing protein [Armatimonadetes bacterium]|nr:prepilin-type N-terminal cleavage/methylation domain-containing protein [Armatimonadota bacterium]